MKICSGKKEILFFLGIYVSIYFFLYIYIIFIIICVACCVYLVSLGCVIGCILKRYLCLFCVVCCVADNGLNFRRLLVELFNFEKSIVMGCVVCCVNIEGKLLKYSRLSVLFAVSLFYWGMSVVGVKCWWIGGIAVSKERRIVSPPIIDYRRVMFLLLKSSMYFAVNEDTF